MDQRIVLPALQKFLGVFEHGRVGFIVWRREIEERFAENAAHSGGFGFLGDGVFEVIHVRESSDAGANLFGGGEASAPAHEILRHIFCLGGENVFAEPVVERDVIVKTAEKRHGNVSVAVYETGQDQRAFCVDGLLCHDEAFHSLRAEFSACSDNGDGVSIER